MSQVAMRTVTLGLLLFGVAALSGCGDPNKDATFNVDAGQHTTDWLPHNHAAAAGSDLNSCRNCHGVNLDGGIAGVSCTSCHLGGAASAHPTVWEGTVLTAHGPYVAANGSDSCKNRNCHGNTLAGFGEHPGCNACHSYPGLPDAP